jgi:hypothetical protein
MIANAGPGKNSGPINHTNSSKGETTMSKELGKRLEEIAWALFLIMSGALWLAPKGWIPEGTWLAGFGLILLGLNAARRLYGLKVEGFGLVVGLAAFAAGIGRMLGRDLPFVAILLILVGLAMTIKAVVPAGKRDDGGAA